MEIGLTYVPLHLEFPEDRIAQIKKVTNFDNIRYELFERIISMKNAGNLQKTFDLADSKTLYIMFTSGVRQPKV